MKTLFLIVALVAIVSVVFVACKNAMTSKEQKVVGDKTTPSVIQDLKTPDWVKNAVIYEINVRQHSKEGTLNNVTKDLQRIKELGVDIVWLMPIYPLCEKNKKCGDHETTECLGSHYAAADFEAVNPKYGTMDDLRNLVKRGHEVGLKVILDFVPNHTGWDSKWMKEHPEWFAKDKDGNITDPVNEKGEKWGWTDVAQLDHANPKLREAWMQVHEFWIKNADVDGFREDVAGEVPDNYWKELRPRLNKLKPIFMLSEDEGHGKAHFDECFEANYGWGNHGIMKEIYQEKKTADALNAHTEDIKNRFGKRGWQMNFTQNHDENSWNGTEKELFGEGGDCYTALCFTMEGMGLILAGQEMSLNKRLSFFNKDEIDWNGKSRKDFFSTLSNLKHTNKALWNGQNGGELKKIETTDDHKVYAFTREKDGDKVVCVYNMSKEAVKVNLKGDAFVGTFSDVFGKSSATLTKDMSFDLKAFEYHIFTNK